MNENLEKIATVEQAYNENEEGKRIAEQQSFQNEEAAEQMESQLEEARQIAMTSNHKYEDSERKLKIVSNDLERIIERGDEFDGKCRATEDELRQLQDKVCWKEFLFWVSNFEGFSHFLGTRNGPNRRW